MRQDFGDFLRHGGSGQYLLSDQDGRIVDHQLGLSVKSAYPNYSALRAEFTERLDTLATENARMILHSLTPPDTPPVVTVSDLRDIEDVKTEALEQWDTRLEAIFSDYHAHPNADQRMRTQRMAAEERLLRAFAGAINQLRQDDLGITHYIWRSEDDAKVRHSHQTYDDRVFRWDTPPEGGHPGQAHNCRCHAEPVAPGVQSNVVLADFALPFDGGAVLSPAELIGGLRAATGLGAALLTSDVLQDWTDAMRDRRVGDAGSRLGLDLTTVEGRLAAMAYALIQEGITSGGYPVLEKTPAMGRIGAEAAALYELMNPGTILETGSGGDPEKQRALQDFIRAAGEAYEAGRLSLQEGRLSQGWVEVLPELTEEELRLGQLPGFTPERMEQWLESYPAEDLGLPPNTGTPIPTAPIGNVISTPIPEDMGPNIVAQEIGDLNAPEENDMPPNFGERSAELANENGIIRTREGRAGARIEAATGTTLARPNPADPAFDFVDTSNGERIEVKGPVPAVDGIVPEKRLNGLIEATVDEANLQSGADRIIVDAEGLSPAQVDRLRQELENRISSNIRVDIMR